MRGERLRVRWLIGTAIAGLVLAGCSLRVDKEKSGKAEHVEIDTPMGGLKVRTNIDPKDTGLSVYANSRPKEKSKKDDDSSANVNISLPFFTMKVVAMEFETDDSAEKVIDFYRKDMARYGKVIECHGTKHGGQTTSNSDKDINLKLECDDEDAGSKSIQLKAGQGNSQRIVGVTPKGKGTEFALIYLQIKSGEREPM